MWNLSCNERNRHRESWFTDVSAGANTGLSSMALIAAKTGRVINSRRSPVLFAVMLVCLMSPAMLKADISTVRTDRLRSAALCIWHNNFPAAIDIGMAYINAEPTNPVGYFLLGVTNYSISNQFRTDATTESTYFYIDTCIALSEVLIAHDSTNPDWHFLLGSAYGYRALHKGVHGGGMSVLKDANKASSYLKKCLELDSTYADAWYGIGAGHFWKSARLKLLLWLPFLSDKRKQGIREILTTCRSGYLASLSASKALLPIYSNQKRFEDVVKLSDSLLRIVPNDASCLLYEVRALAELNRFSEADVRLQQLRATWQNSLHFDSCGSLEADYLAARIAFGRKDMAAARISLDRVLAAKQDCHSNEFFNETLKLAESLARKLR